MQSYLLKDDIWWVGSIDWNLRDFHGYETSRGTTYNSYLILDDKPALVDGSRHGFGSEVLSRIAGRIDPKKIEYFVVNHVAVSYTHLRAHETVLDLVCRLLLEKKKKKK